MGKYKILNNNYHMKKYSELNLKLLSFHTKSPIAAVVISISSLVSNGIHLLSVMNKLEVKGKS